MNTDHKKVIFFIIFCVFLALFKDLSAEAKLKLFIEKHIWTHSILEYTISYCNIVGMVISAFLTLFIFYIPVRN